MCIVLNLFCGFWCVCVCLSAFAYQVILNGRICHFVCVWVKGQLELRIFSIFYQTVNSCYTVCLIHSSSTSSFKKKNMHIFYEKISKQFNFNVIHFVITDPVFANRILEFFILQKFFFPQTLALRLKITIGFFIEPLQPT